MNVDRKVTFTLSIGYVGAKHEDTYTLKELGIKNYETEEELEELLEEEWLAWTENYIDGGFHLED